MELYKEILIEALSHEQAEVTFPNLKLDAKALVDSACYRALEQIRDILRDDALSDPECFAKIEAIVAAFEALGSGGGTRHDF